MKKRLFLLLFLASFLIIQTSYAQTPENEIMPINEVIEQPSVTIEKDNEAPNFLLEVKWDTLDALNDKKNDFKITKDGKVGYLNADLKYSFLTDYDDISPLGNYLKIKKENKFGVIDISGREILTPEFDRISLLTNDDGREYIVAKKDGKYRLFYNTGVIVPEENLYTITNDSSVILARDIKPDLRKYIKNSKVNFEALKNKTESYKIDELELPENIVNTQDEQVIDDVIKNTDLEVINLNDSLIQVANKKFYFDKTTEKVGLKNANGKQIIPSVFDELTFNKPCKHFLSPIVLAKKDDGVSVYGTNGKLLAISADNIINVYKYGKIFSLDKSSENMDIYADGKVIGTLKKEDRNYSFKRKGFNIYPMHNISMIMITLLK